MLDSLSLAWMGFRPTFRRPSWRHEDSGQTLYPVEIRDGEIFVCLEPELPRERTVTEVMVETMVDWGVKKVFGMAGHSNLGLADAIRLRANDGDLGYMGVRHDCAAAFAASADGKLTSKPTACLTFWIFDMQQGRFSSNQSVR